jgi:soluble lytic murein transglycosylase
MRFKTTLLIASLAISLSAKNFKLHEFETLPKSYAKDFYIWQYLKKGVSSAEAHILYPQIKRLSPKLKKEFSKYIDELKREAYCKKLSADRLALTNGDCVKMGLSLYRATTVKKETIDKIVSNIHLFYPKLSREYQAISKKSFDELLKLPNDELLRVFNSVGDRFRKDHFDRPFPKERLRELVKLDSFNTLIEKAVRRGLENVAKSIVEIDSGSLNSESNFLLGLNAIKHGQLGLALIYFDYSKRVAKTVFEKDRALFWKYLLNRDRSILDKLIDSHEINIYTLRAYEILRKFPTNIITSIEPKTDKTPFDIRDPFAWIKFKEMVDRSFFSYEDKRKWIMQYNTKESEPHVARILYRFKDKKRFYLTPYSEYLRNLPLERKVLIYSIARQESHFIPTDVSYSYALGMMQFMPFVAKDIAKKEGMSDFELEDLFDPKIAYKFANIHLDYLQKHLSHPLFIAYAYNGGIGFTKREILSKNYFKGGAYEPFWSMEMVPNAQARKYAKRVLANYVVYSKILGVDTTLSDLLEKLK